MEAEQVNIALTDIVEYQTFRRNPGPIITRATEGRPMLLIKGRKRVVMLDASKYEQLVRRASMNERPDPREQRTGTEG
jgi:PHD/YefM family antitoxin component YafN of YafNO toxin-antitoxin module